MKRLKYLLIFLLFIQQAFNTICAQEIRVACIGNSITYGTGLTDEERVNQTYPIRLQELLINHYTNTNFNVKNFGLPGRTVLRNSTDTYWNESQLKDATEFNPNIVIIKFGTNDAGNSNWLGSRQGKNHFYEDYTDFINLFKSLTSRPIIYICYPIPLFRNITTDQIRILREEVIPTIKRIARTNRVHLIDLHSPFFEGVNRNLILKVNANGDEELVHPNAAGAELIANEVFKMIKMTYKP